MEMVNVKINGRAYEVPKDSTILEAARYAGIAIPTLCYLKDLNEIGACRICVVEVKGARSLVASCVYPVNDGMEIYTNTPTVLKSRKMSLELMLSNHNKSCLTCVRSGNCDLQKLCRDYGVEDAPQFEGKKTETAIDASAAHMVRDNSKCILCRRCIAACDNQAIGVIGANNRGFDTVVGCSFNKDLDDTSCVSCGQCIVNCPVGAIYEKDDTAKVWDAINDPAKRVIVQTAPSIRVALGECFGMPIGTNVKGKMVAALRRLGFDDVFDTDVSADLTIVEEATELIDRIKNGGKLPMITSCSPGWVKYAEFYYPELLEHLSSCKSPQQMFGAVAKTYYAEKLGMDPKDIVVVAIMPCTAKKFEIGRDDQDASGVADVDIALTTRELGNMIDRAGINFTDLPDEDFDEPLGISTGAGVIFGTTGGVMEAALRTAADWITGDNSTPVDFLEVRGTDGIKEATYKLGDLDVKVAVASGLSNAKVIMDKIKNGEADYQFIEIMCCPGGCVNGGGQPIQPASVRNMVDLRTERAKVLYDEDKNLPLRKSHESPVIKTLYNEYFDDFGSHKAHKILHTSYVKRGKY